MNENKFLKYKRWLRNIRKLIVDSFLLVCIPYSVFAITVIAICSKIYSFLPILATILEIYGVLLVFLSEIFSSSISERWSNPDLAKGIEFPFTQSRNYILKDGKKHYYTIGLGRILKQILTQAESYIELFNDIKLSWFWLNHSPNEKTCKKDVQARVTKVGSNKDLQEQINEITKYGSTKVFGYIIIFFGFIIQMIFNLLSLNLPN